MTNPDGLDAPLSEENPERPEPWPIAWVASASVSLLALTAWQRSPEWGWLLLGATGTLASAIMIRSTRRPRSWAIGATAMLAVAVALAVGDTIDLQKIEHDWPRWSADERENRAKSVAKSVSNIAARLTQSATRVASDTTLLKRLDSLKQSSATGLSVPMDQSVESALMVFHGDRLIGHTGQVRTIVAPRGPTGLRLADEPFYASLQSRVTTPDGSFQVVAVALISATPPADRFSRSLIQTLAGGAGRASTVIQSPDSVRVEEGATVELVTDGPTRLARVRALGRSEDETRLSLLQKARSRTGVPLALAAVLMLVASWRRPARTLHRWAVAAVLLLAVAVAPLSALSNVSPLFDASNYFAPMGGPLTANVASLLLTTALGLSLLFLTLRSGRVLRLTSSRILATLLVLVSATLGPFILRDLSRGIVLPANGVSLELWIAWQLAIALAGASVLHAGAAVGRTVLGKLRGLSPIAAPTIAIAAAILAPVLWRAPGAWPPWYPVLWALSILALTLTRRGVALVTGAAIIAGAGAVTLTWGATERARMQLAQYDLARLSERDENAEQLLRRFVESLAAGPATVSSSASLLRRYAASELADAGYPARLARWDSSISELPITDLQLAPVSDPLGAQAIMAAEARRTGSFDIRTVPDGPTTNLVAAVPVADSVVVTIAVPPRTRLVPFDPFATLTGISGTAASGPPYRMSLATSASADSVESIHQLEWRRTGDTMHGDAVVRGDGESRQIHIEVELRGLDALLPRGALLVLLDVAIVVLLWGASAMADGAFGRWFRVRRVRLWRSYRVRLSATLAAFFIVPAALFAGWSWYRLQDDDRASRELLLREALRTAASDVSRRDLAITASSVGSPIFVYKASQLEAVSDTLLQSLAPLGRLLPTTLDDSDFGPDDVFTTRRLSVGFSQALVGFRHVFLGVDAPVVVTPARGDEFALDERREDLGILLLFTAALGALAAMWSSGIAARSLARPVGALREAALTIAAGREAPGLGSAPASEFAPVYRAFGRMAEDLKTSRAALEAAQRRTEAVLQNVASGVLAVRSDGDIVIANPRAEQLLGVPLRQRGASIASLSGPQAAVTERFVAFLNADDDDDAFDIVVSGRQLRGRLTRLSGGAVLTLDDVTELASAQRVLAWGEMARQVAHEIKNPLTPIRLGVQHLRRAFRDGRGDFGNILDANVTRVLAEIDHLDEIARSFSRYGMAPDQRAPAVAVDAMQVVRAVLDLEQLGDSGVEWTFDVPDEDRPVMVMGQRDELKDVLLNLLENSRLAHARKVAIAVRIVPEGVAIEVRDDGQGIAADVLPRVFEPHFSTRTSGSGLGLAISRRLIEGWGGRVTLQSTPGSGTVVQVMLRPA